MNFCKKNLTDVYVVCLNKNNNYRFLSFLRLNKMK